MSLKVYLDGKFIPEKEAKVSVLDHGLLYGDGVFEGIRAYNGRVFRLSEHLDRLYESAKTIMLKIHLPKDELEQVVLETMRVNKLRDAYIRLVVTRGRGDLGLDPRKCPKATIFVITDKIVLYPASYYREGLAIVTVATQSSLLEVLNPRVKSLNYLNNIMAKVEAINAGVEEAIMLTQDGYVSECTGDNIFMLRRGVLLTPPTYLGILEGITRNAVIELARKLRLEVNEQIFTRHDLFNAEECFLTGTAAEVVPVTKIDGRVIGEGKPGEITKKLIEEFRLLTQMEGAPVYDD